ncbi:hypothetical protein PGTUg99_011725 [Puccinia graminis f. sp. tritici]|uniref:Uncharacterized protein n=1 Tax=Puccinia graminis f. sp. tritici TaxID=56615 RepID=A0A5B0NKW3_PUCGR|nr:hypothetical protein PGTUg99_011725 [Puccinia graminis f. sp. tritici]
MPSTRLLADSLRSKCLASGHSHPTSDSSLREAHVENLGAMARADGSTSFPPGGRRMKPSRLMRVAGPDGVCSHE